MDMWIALQKERILHDFSSKRVLLNTKPRRNASLSAIAEKSRELEMCKATFLKYSRLSAQRYLLARSILFDVLVTVYNVNSFELFAFRAAKRLDGADVSLIRKKIGMMKRPDIEIRVIGMQNGHDELLDVVDKVRKITNAQMIETDLFGNEIRNVAIDAKNGSAYDLLLMDRIYRPVELINGVKFEDAMKDSKQLSFI